MSLKIQAVSGVKWTTLSTVVVTVLQLVQLSVLARYLEASAFGLMALVMIAIGLLQAFADMGISNAIIHRQEITSDQLSSLYWLNVISGFVLYLVIYSISPAIAGYYDEAQLTALLRIVGLNFIITSLGNQYRVLFQKYLKFNLMAKVEIISFVLSTSCAVVLAVYGFGVYSLVYSYIVNTSAVSLILIVLGLKIQVPRLHFRYGEIKSFISFGLYQMGEKSINYLSANIDKMIIGKLLSMDALGYYNLAWQLVVFPLLKINPIITKVLFPVLSKVQNSVHKMNYYYLKSTYILMVVNAPLLFGLIATAAEAVNLLYGEKWGQSVVLVQILAVVGLFKSFGNTGGAVLLAKGKADIGFFWNFVWASYTTLVTYIFLKIFNNVESVAYAQLFAAFTLGLVWHYIIIKVGNINYRLVLKKCYQPVLYSLIMFLVISFLNFLPLHQNLIFGMKVVLGMLVYFKLINIRKVIKSL